MEKFKSLIVGPWALIIVLILASVLRLWKLDSNPVSLFGDELDVGYHAYSILKTGRDYSGNFLPIHFHSLAEWRTPLYLYSVVPTVALFGISPLGVRLPAALFGILGVWAMYLLVNKLMTYERNGGQPVQTKIVSVTAALIMAINPWHLQYSRAGFEVTQLLTFVIFGLFFFLKALRDGKYLWTSVFFLVLTPWVYSTAKLFTPLLLIFLFTVWKKEIATVNLANLLKTVIIGLVVGVPILVNTLFGGGVQRASHLSIFTDPKIEPQIGIARTQDVVMRGDSVSGYEPNLSDRFWHNKIVFWFENISNNYLQAFSLDFLFIEGDPNLRHSIKGVGQFYKVEAITLILGIILFSVSKIDLKIKLLILFLTIIGALPAALTRDGGNHATRLILVLPPLVFLMSYGLVITLKSLKPKFVNPILLAFCSFWILSSAFYLHDYYVHDPLDSERWWHAGFRDAIQSIKVVESDFDRVIISMVGEPAWIFFAAGYEYPPEKWQKEFPIGNDVEVKGFGKISHTDKFYFATVDPKIGIYGLPGVIDTKTLYLANSSEIGANLILEPERTPPGLSLLKSIPLPSGEPAFYLFTKS